MSESDRFITTKEAARITGFARNTICRWASQKTIAARPNNDDDRQDKWEVSVESLFDHVESLEEHYRREGPDLPQDRNLPPRRLDPEIEKCMNPWQLEAHRVLMTAGDKIECPRGARFSESFCRNYVRKHYGLEKTAECKARKCPRYKKPGKRPVQESRPILSPGPAHIQRLQQQSLKAEADKKAKETAIKRSFTSRDRKRADEIEAKYASTLAKLQAARKAKAEKQSERQKTQFQIYREKERERRIEEKANAEI
jgi:uncharacterized protein YqgV (UPF0045/DUF77 family)